jgi:hypothetical protein
MTRLKAFMVAMVAATTIAVGGLSTAPSASAATNLTCSQAAGLSVTYAGLAAAAYADGSTFWGHYYAFMSGLYGSYC